MKTVIVACVWVQGNRRYEISDVLRLRKMVAHHTPDDYNVVFTCITDRPAAVTPHKILPIHMKYKILIGWWAKMFLLSLEWRKGIPVVYLDLDTVITGSLAPLFDYVLSDAGSGLSICKSFTKAVSPAWPCMYGSCVMTFGSNLSDSMWKEFLPNASAMMGRIGKYGDQKVIEELNPFAAILQEHLPNNYMIGYREFPYHPKQPDDNAIVIYAGGRSPNTLGPNWVKKHWRV